VVLPPLVAKRDTRVKIAFKKYRIERRDIFDFAPDGLLQYGITGSAIHCDASGMAIRRLVNK
jgi:hypothetical protein